MSNTTIYYDPTEVTRGTADQAVARHNTAAYALMGAIAEALHPAHGCNWGHAGDAQRVATELLQLYVEMTGRQGDEHGVIEIPTDKNGPDIRIQARRVK